MNIFGLKVGDKLRYIDELEGYGNDFTYGKIYKVVKINGRTNVDIETNYGIMRHWEIMDCEYELVKPINSYPVWW